MSEDNNPTEPTSVPLSPDDPLPSEINHDPSQLPSEPSLEESGVDGEQDGEQDGEEDGEYYEEEYDEDEGDYEDPDSEPSMDVIFAYVSDEFYENGNISEETYNGLVEYGFPESLINNYFSGLQAMQTQLFNEVYETAGSQENYNHLTSWAEKNLSDQEINAFNRAIDSNDVSTIKLSLQGLMNKYEQAEGSFGSNMQGYTNGVNQGSQYENMDQWLRDSTDPRYETDPHYRQKVQDKYLRSKSIMGVNNLDYSQD